MRLFNLEAPSFCLCFRSPRDFAFWAMQQKQLRYCTRSWNQSPPSEDCSLNSIPFYRIHAVFETFLRPYSDFTPSFFRRQLLQKCGMPDLKSTTVIWILQSYLEPGLHTEYANHCSSAYLWTNSSSFHAWFLHTLKSTFLINICNNNVILQRQLKIMNLVHA